MGVRLLLLIFLCGYCRVLRGHNHAVRCVVVKQRCVVSGGVDRTIRVWSVDTFAPVAVLRGIGANNFGIILDMHVR